CDPSHIAGNKDLILQICQHAIDLDMDGFMVETHYNPEKALTDARQQITPKALSELWDKLEFKSQFVEKPLQMQRIEMMRDEIDSIDHHILELLAKRMDVVKDIGLLKQKQKITILQIKRWNNIFENRLAFGKKLGIESGFLKKLLQALHQESIRIQRDLEQKTKNKNKQ
ncbi:MAG: chorismate mutase, partial [Bacteroidales bacterium]